jgi:ubiquinone/menaquinone biosynthesis C-methylase UbiE
MTNIFNQYFRQYDDWYKKNKYTYLSELKLLSRLIPKAKKGLEIGVGTGRFAEPLGIKYGIDPAEKMLEIAAKRGIVVRQAAGENIPFEDNTFDYVAIIITLAFVKNPKKVVQEALRVLKKKGKIIIGFVEGNSFLADFYRTKEGPFYKKAKFIKVNRLLGWLKKESCQKLSIYQTLFNIPKDITDIQPYKKGFGAGGFVVIEAQKAV